MAPSFIQWCPKAWPPVSRGTRIWIISHAGGHLFPVSVPSASEGRGSGLLPGSDISLPEQGGSAGTLAETLIHPLWFCLWKVSDQAANYSSAIIVFEFSALLLKGQLLCLLHPPQVVAELGFKQTIARQEFPCYGFPASNKFP